MACCVTISGDGVAGSCKQAFEEQTQGSAASGSVDDSVPRPAGHTFCYSNYSLHRFMYFDIN